MSDSRSASQKTLRERSLVVVLLMIVSPVVFAQEQTSAVQGTVRDPSKGVVAGARVEARGVAGVTIAATTDFLGFYRIASLTPGRYVVAARAQGFEPKESPTLELTLGASPVIDFELAVASSSVEITVDSNAPVIDTTSSTTSMSMKSELFDQLPHARDFTSIATFSGLASSEFRAHGISIGGSTGAENRFVLDGVDITNPLDGSSGKVVIPEIVDEVQVKLAGYEAEFGGATGGVINAITKGGGNDFHGWIGGDYSEPGWNGSPRPAVFTNGAGFAFKSVQAPRENSRTADPGFAASGRLVRDHAWFFTTYQPTAIRYRRTVTFNDGVTSTFGQSFQRQNATTNLTATLFDRVATKVAANLSGTESEGVLPPLHGIASSLPDAYERQRSRTRNGTYSAYLDTQISSSWLASLRGGRFDTTVRDHGVPDQRRVSFENSNETIPGIPQSLVRPEGFDDIPNNLSTSHDDYRRDNVALDGSWLFHLGGTHLLKSGVQYEHLKQDVLSGMLQPNYLFGWNEDDFFTGEPSGKYGTLVIELERNRGKASSHQRALFLQDSWTSSRLTVNFGLRSENETVPNYFDSSLGFPSTAVHFTDADKLAPRLGLAFDVRGDSRWKLYGSYGTFFDRFKLALPLNAFGGYRDVYYTFRLNTFDWPNIVCTGLNALPTDTPSCSDGVEFTALYPNLPKTFNQSLFVAPDLKPTESREWSAGLDHQLSSASLISARYIHRQLVHAVETVRLGGQGSPIVLANPGEGVAAFPQAGLPRLPRPVRDYDAMELEWSLRPSHRWGAHASYIYSRLWGNYSGVLDTDNLGKAYGGAYGDAVSSAYDSHAHAVYGPLATDRPHRFKAQIVGNLPWQIGLGISEDIASGTPISTQASYRGATFFPYGRGDLGRTATASQTDLLVSKRFPLPRRYSAELSLNVLNLFDQDQPVAYFSRYSNRPLRIPESEFFAGFDAEQKLAALPKSPFYGKPYSYQAPREIRLGVKLIF